MRNLKKFLALVLAMMMVMGLMVTANAATKFDDDAKVDPTYRDAVDIMAALGVFQGNANSDGTTTLKPEENIKRAELAAVLYRIATADVKGEKPALAVYDDVEYGPFTDLEQGHWSVKFINYAYSKQWLKGVSATEYRPNSYLTVPQTLMGILRVLGLDDGIEGKGWENKAILAAIDADLLKNVDNSLLKSSYASRQLVAQIAYNAVTHVPEGKETVYIVKNGNTVVYEGSDPGEAALMATLFQTVPTVKEGSGSLMTDVFKVAPKTVTDEFGRTTTEMQDANGNTILKVESETDKPVASFTGAKSESAIFAEVGAAGFQGVSDKYIVMDEIWVDGVLVAKATKDNDANLAIDPNSHIFDSQAATGYAPDSRYAETIVITKTAQASDIQAIGTGNGVCVEIYATGVANHYRMVIVNEKITTVAAVNAANESAGTGRSITLTGVAGKTFATDDENLKAGVTVLYKMSGGEIYDVYGPEVKSGAVTAITGATGHKSSVVYTIGGVEYKLSEHFTGTAPAITNGTTVTYWYVDSNGYIIKDTVAPAAGGGTTATTHYGYLLRYENAGGTSSDSMITGETTVGAVGEKFKFVDETGTTVTLDGAYTTNDDGSVNKFVASTAGSAQAALNTGSVDWSNTEQGKIAGVLFAYTLNEDGKINNITGVGAGATDKTTTTTVAVTKGTPTISGTSSATKYGTDNTVYFFADLTAGSEKYAVYVGYTKVPNKTSKAHVADPDTATAYWICDANDNVEAIVLLVAAGGTTEGPVTSGKQYVYFASTAYDEKLVGTTPVYVYSNVYINGVKDTITLAASHGKTIAAGDLWEFTTTSGVSALESSKVTLSDAGAVSSINSTYIMVGGSPKFISANTVYYLIDNGTMVKVDKLSDITVPNGKHIEIQKATGTGADNDNPYTELIVIVK